MYFGYLKKDLVSIILMAKVLRKKDIIKDNRDKKVNFMIVVNKVFFSQICH